MQNERKSSFKLKERRRVAIVMESSGNYARGLLSGVLNFKRESGLWSVSFCDTHLRADISHWLKEWHGEGILLLSNNCRLNCCVKSLKIPTVLLDSATDSHKWSNIEHDNVKVSQYCFEHLKECGFTNFAFYGQINGAGHKERKKCFQRMVRNAGLRCFIYSHQHRTVKIGSKRYEGLGLKDRGQVAEWVKRLPKPVGVMACDDRHAQHILDASRALGLVSPKDIAAIGVGNDELFCDLCYPPLTSVVTNDEQVGFQAAMLLSDMMSGKIRSRRKIVVEPTGIVIRRSTRLQPVNGTGSVG
jgi:LacI family transcriptional regulator